MLAVAVSWPLVLRLFSFSASFVVVVVAVLLLFVFYLFFCFFVCLGFLFSKIFYLLVFVLLHVCNICACALVTLIAQYPDTCPLKTRH